MADFTALKTAIQQNIKQNGNEEITGNILQEVLLAMVQTLGDSAINDLATALANEALARQNADGSLQGNIDAEALARGNADGLLSGRIGDEETSRSNADTALQNAINTINTKLAEGYVYVGIATTSTNPSTPSGKVFYIAVAAGTYTNFLNSSSQPQELTQGINILKFNGTAWSVEQVWGVDDEPTANSNNIVKSGGVFDKVMTDGSAFDISAHFASGGLLATYADLSAALTALNTLSASYKRGGMSIKFVQSSDNKYIQARLMSDSFTTDVTQWQVVEDTPQEKSKNIISSGGIFNQLLNIGIESSADIAPSITNSGAVRMDGSIGPEDGYHYSEPILVEAGNMLAVKVKGATSVASIAEKIDDIYFPQAACMGSNPSFQFYVAKTDTSIVISTNDVSSAVVKVLSNETLKAIADNYTEIINNTLYGIENDGAIKKWSDIPAIEGAFEINTFSFENSKKGTHKVIPVSPNDEIVLFTSHARTYYGFLKSYSVPVLSHDNTIDYASGSSRTIVNSTTAFTKVTAPSDAKYLVLCNTYNEYDWSPTYLTINGYDVFTGLKRQVIEDKENIGFLQYKTLLSYDCIPIKSGNIDTGIIYNRKSLPTINGHRELPVKAGQLVKIYPSENRVSFAIVKKVNADGTFVYATGYSANITRTKADGPIEFTIPFDCTMLLISEYYTTSGTTYHWYAKDILIDGCSIINSQKDENIIWKSIFVENMLLGGDPITPVQFTLAIPSGGDTLEDGSVCVGYYGGPFGVWSEATAGSHPYDTFAGLTVFNMLNPTLTQESYKALKDGDVVMWNQTDGQPDPEGESVVWRGEGIGRLNQTTDTCAKFIDDNTIRVVTNTGNCICYIDFDRMTKTFETTEYQGQTINVGHMILLKIGDSYFKTDITTSNVEGIENAISAIDSNFTSYERQLAWDGNPVRLGGVYWLNVNISRCQCLFKSTDLKVFEFVRVIPSGHSSPECEFAPLGNYLYGIVRGWKNADAENGGYSQLFKYDVVNDTFSDFVELEGLCGERPAFAIVDNKIYTINRVGNTVYDGSIIQRGNKLFQVYDLNFNLLNTVPMNFRRGCNTIQFIVHAKSLYAFVPTDARGLVVTQNAEGRNDLVWTYIDVRYLNK